MKERHVPSDHVGGFRAQGVCVLAQCTLKCNYLEVYLFLVELRILWRIYFTAD